MQNLGIALWLGVPVLWWCWVATSRLWRHRRALLVAAILTVGWLALPTLPPSPVRRWAEPVLGLLMLAVMLAPGRLGLFAIRGRQAEADRRLRAVSTWLRAEPRDVATGSTLADRLAPGSFPDVGAEWAVSAALFRHSLSRRLGEHQATLVPATYYERAARSFWRAAIEGELLKPDHAPNAWDEGVSLRSYDERFRSLIPTQALADRPLVPLGGWDDEAEAVIDELRVIPLRNPAAIAARSAHAAAMTDVLALARGDRSEEALARHRSSDESLRARWAVLDDEVRRSVEPVSASPGSR